MPDEQTLDIDGRPVAITSPDKVFFAERGETKLDLLRYYLAVAEPFLRAAGGRPTLMQRFPGGAQGKSFFQKRVPESAPEWLETAIVSTPNGTTSRALVLADMAHVAWAVNLACLGFHVWPHLARPSRASRTSCASTSTRSRASASRRCARRRPRCAALLDELGIVGFPKTTGNRGLHVYVRLEPRWDSYEVRAAAVAAARELERRRPELITAAWWKEERGERVFVDFNQNAPHKTVFGAWSVRARAGAQVSTPVAWDEIEAIHPDELTIASVPERLAAAGRPVGGDQRAAAVARAAARLVGARPGGGPHGRPLAAGLPEAARRAASRRPEQGAQGCPVARSCPYGHALDGSRQPLAR